MTGSSLIRRGSRRAGPAALAIVLGLAIAGVLATPQPADARQVECPSGYLALTFDDGPDVHTPAVLEVLVEHRAAATFFVEGAKVDQRPWLVADLAAQGHEVANHTYDHERLTELTDEQIQQTVLDTHDAILAAGVEPLHLLRPPFAATDARVEAAVREVGYEPVLWDIDSRDWEVPASEIVSNVLGNLHAGAVILLHDGSSNTPETVEALPTIIEEARERGYCFRVLDANGDVIASPFDDVRFATHRSAIRTLAAAGVTEGCNPPIGNRYCPGESVTREQMASFLSRALGLDDEGTAEFDDVPAGTEHGPQIRHIATAGITRGCDSDGDLFCPHDEVTREQMASFLARALDLDGSGDGGFTDVTAGSEHAAAIDAIASAGITQGCDADDPNLFCPREPVTRAQMASFLVRSGVV